MQDNGVLEQWIEDPNSSWSDLELRLLRRVPKWSTRLAPRLVDPIERALVGIEELAAGGDDLVSRVRIALSRADGGLPNDPGAMAQLEIEAQNSGDVHLWLTAARLHAQVSQQREAQARMAISDQVLPYVFPGEIDHTMAHILCAGERILPALHVDWIRKLTVWLAPAIAVDCKHGGLWFWPVIRSLDAGKLKRPLSKLATSRLPSGGYGLAAAYSRRIGLDDSALLQAGDETDQRISMLAFLGDASR